MQNDKKPAEKRRIGPAMQWAKPRGDIDRAHERKRSRINIDLDLETDWETAQPESTENSRQYSSETIDTRPRPHQNHPGARTDSQSYGASGAFTRGQSNRPRFNDETNSDTAWDFYTGNGNGGEQTQFNTAGSHQGQNYPHFNDAASDYPHQVDSPNYNARSTDITMAQDNKTDGPGLRQLLLPILVVGLIIVVGFLASLG